MERAFISRIRNVDPPSPQLIDNDIGAIMIMIDDCSILKFSKIAHCAILALFALSEWLGHQGDLVDEDFNLLFGSSNLCTAPLTTKSFQLQRMKEAPSKIVFRA